MRKALLLLLSLVIIAGLGVWRVASRSQDASTHDALRVRLKWLHQAQFAGFYAADRQGLYAKQDVAVQLLPGGVDQPALAQVITGVAEIGVTGADQVLLAREQGHPVVAIAAIYRQTPTKQPFTTRHRSPHSA